MLLLSLIDTSAAVLDIGVVLLLAALFGFLARRIGLPAVVGYLVVGLIVSPFTPGYVASREQVALFADIGVVLLLFEVGIEIDVTRIRDSQRALLWMAPAQVAFTMAVSGLAAFALGLPWFGAAIVGLGIAMSSSVVIVNITRSRKRTTDPATDDALLRWSVLQDIAGVTIAAVLVALAGGQGRGLWQSLGGLVVFAAVAFVVARLLPRVLAAVRWEQDLFLIVSVAAGLTIAALGAVAFHVPMALAAFVAGLALNHEGDIAEVRRLLLPFRDLFAVLFFVVIGSLVRPDYLWAALPFAAALVALLLLTKTIPIAIAVRMAKLPVRPLQLSIGLSQMGEFSYVLGSLAVARGALSSEQFVALLLVVTVTIVGTTVGVRRIGRAST